MKKRLLSALMVFCMVLTLLPVSAFAAEPPAGGSVVTGEVTDTSTDGLVTFAQKAEKIAENTFKITLTVTTSDSVTTTKAQSTDAVLVIDGSSSMNDGGRLAAAKTAANEFAGIVLGEEADGENQIAIVSYQDQPTTHINLSDNLTAVQEAINNIQVPVSAGTNIQAGIYAARTLLEGSTADHKVILVLSDGEPTYSYQATASGYWTKCWVGPLGRHHWGDFLGAALPNYFTELQVTGFDYNEVVGSGSNDWSMAGGILVDVETTCQHGNSNTIATVTPYENHGQPTIQEAAYAKNAGAEIYSIYLGSPNDTNAISTMQGVASGEDHFQTTENVYELADLFKGIAGSITAPTTAGTVTVTMDNPLVQLGTNSFDTAAGIVVAQNGFTWDLSQSIPTILANGKKQYTLTYQITLDTKADSFSTGTPYSTSKDISFTYKVDGTDQTLIVEKSPTVTGTAAERYSVTYDSNQAISGSVPVDPNKYFNGDTAPVLGNTGNLKKHNAVFLGWSTELIGQVISDRNTAETYAPKIKHADDKVVVTDDTVLYAVWAIDVNVNDKPDYVEDTYNITYEENKPDGIEDSVTGLPTDEPNVLSGIEKAWPSSPSLDGYTFTEWTVMPSNVVNNNGRFIMPSEDVTFTANWKKNVPPATEKNVTIYYYCPEESKVVGKGTVTVDADATTVDPSSLSDVPTGYEVVDSNPITITNGEIQVVVSKKATSQDVKVYYYCPEESKIVGEGTVTVGADATTVDPSSLSDVPTGYEVVDSNPITITNGEIQVVVSKKATSQDVKVYYYCPEESKIVGEGTVTVGADATTVDPSSLSDVPTGYEVVDSNPITITNGEIQVVVSKKATSQDVKVYYYCPEESKIVGEGTVTVDADATTVDPSSLSDVPTGYEVVDSNPITITNGEIQVVVSKKSTTREIGLNYWDVVNNVQVAEGSLTVAADATNVNTSTFTDIPEGYELVWTGDLPIVDGWVWVEVRPTGTETKSVGLNYWDVVNNVQVAEGSLTVAADATNVNTSTFTDIPEGYELVWTGDLPIVDGWVWVEVRPADTETKSVGLNYWDVVNNVQVAEGSLTVAADATSVNTSTFTDIPEGYELVWTGDLPIVDGWVWVEVRPVDTETKSVGLNYWDVVNNVQVAEGSLTVAADATNVNTSTFTDIPEGYELVWTGDLPIVDGWVWVEVRPTGTETKSVGLNYWDVVNNVQVAEGSLTVAADATNVNTSTFTDIPEGYELVWTGDLPIVDGWVWVEVRPVDTETKSVGLNYWDVLNNKQAGEGKVTVPADATNVNTSTFTDIPEGYELVWTGDLPIVDGWVWVEVRPADTETKSVGLNYWDVVNNVQVAEGSLTVAADATSVNTSTFTDIPEGYELVWTGDLPIVDGWVWVEIRPADTETKSVGLNYWDVVNNVQVAEGSLTVAADATNVNTSTFTDIPEGYELVWTGDLPIVDGWVWVEVRPADTETKSVGLNYWDVVNNVQVAEGSLTVAADATNVNTSTFTDIPEGYELVWTGDLPIVDGWVWVEVRPADTETKSVGLNYWDVVNNVQVAEGSLTVAADATNVNTSTFTDIPEGYELVWTGDLPIVDGWVWVEVRPADTETKSVGLNYWDVVNNVQVAEGSLTVAADATNVNTSTFTDIPEGYELVWTGDLPIVDGWVWVEVRPVEAPDPATQSVTVTYWDTENDQQVGESFTITVDADATYVNTSSFTDIPAGYELAWTGDLPIVDGAVRVELRPIEEPVPATYTITASAENGGSISPNGTTTVNEGDDLTFTIRANSNYDIDEVYVDGKSVGSVSRYTFSDVSEDHTIRATFTRESSGGGSGGSGSSGGGSDSDSTGNLTISLDVTGGSDEFTFTVTFTDEDDDELNNKFHYNGDSSGRIGSGDEITLADGDEIVIRNLPEGTRYEVAIETVEGYTYSATGEEGTIRTRGNEAEFTVSPVAVAADPSVTGVADWLNTSDHIAYLTGYPGGNFGPDSSMTRAEVAQMFYALLNNKNVTITKTFADVPSDAWYATAVNTLGTLGMVTGDSNGNFRPNDPITRAEFCVIALAFAYEPEDYSCSFYDVSRSDWFYPYVAQASTYGWIGGYTSGNFGPNDQITRAQVTTIVNNMLGREADQDYVADHQDDLVQFNDLSQSHWAYYDVMEAVNAHDFTKTNGNESWD